MLSKLALIGKNTRIVLEQDGLYRRHFVAMCTTLSNAL